MENEGVFDIERLLNGVFWLLPKDGLYNQKPNPKDKSQTWKSFEIQRRQIRNSVITSVFQPLPFLICLCLLQESCSPTS